MTAGIYIHIPFCRSRCSYCDFATDVYRDNGVVERYVLAVCKEIERSGNSVQPPATAGGTDIDTIYFGGGTPSLLTPSQLEAILNSVSSGFSISAGAEITMEMNPATVTAASLAAYRCLGVNRASFGVQTFDDHLLKLLARGHDADDARATFALLRQAGFDNVSFDLIAGLPHQTLAAWEKNLDEALLMSPEHLSLYLLEIHQGTPLAEQVRSGRQPKPDDELAATMYEMMSDKLTRSGYAQYEISNFSRPGRESRHNSKYWRLDPVSGFGVSAHSFNGVQRYANERDTAKYVERIEKTGSAEIMREDINTASEYVFLGLRMENGIDLDEYNQLFSTDLISSYAGEIESLTVSGLIEVGDGRLRLSQRGKLFSNEVFAVFV